MPVLLHRPIPVWMRRPAYRVVTHCDWGTRLGRRPPRDDARSGQRSTVAVSTARSQCSYWAGVRPASRCAVYNSGAERKCSDAVVSSTANRATVRSLHELAGGLSGPVRPLVGDASPERRDLRVEYGRRTDGLEDPPRALVDAAGVPRDERQLPHRFGFVQLFLPPCLFVNATSVLRTGHGALDRLCEEAPLVGEHLVHRRDRNAGPRRDVRDARPSEPTLLEHRPPGIEDPGPRERCVFGAKPTLDNLVHVRIVAPY
jgi:hypothetical protein